jgi:hypothetical protein
MKTRTVVLWLLAALLFGVLAMPFLVYGTGVATLGPYANGGASAFFRDYLSALAGFEGAAWMLALGPAVVVVFWLFLRRVFLRPATAEG